MLTRLLLDAQVVALFCMSTNKMAQPSFAFHVQGCVETRPGGKRFWCFFCAVAVCRWSIHRACWTAPSIQHSHGSSRLAQMAMCCCGATEQPSSSRRTFGELLLVAWSIAFSPAMLMQLHGVRCCVRLHAGRLLLGDRVKIWLCNT